MAAPQATVTECPRAPAISYCSIKQGQKKAALFMGVQGHSLKPGDSYEATWGSQLLNPNLL